MSERVKRIKSTIQWHTRCVSVLRKGTLAFERIGKPSRNIVAIVHGWLNSRTVNKACEAFYFPDGICVCVCVCVEDFDIKRKITHFFFPFAFSSSSSFRYWLCQEMSGAYWNVLYLKEEEIRREKKKPVFFSYSFLFKIQRSSSYFLFMWRDP